MKARIDKLVEEEMGSGTQVEQDDFKEAVEKFGGQIDVVQKNLDLAVNNKRAQAAKLFEASKLQNEMVYGLNDEPISGVEAAANLGPSSRTIALNLS